MNRTLLSSVAVLLLVGCTSAPTPEPRSTTTVAATPGPQSTTTMAPTPGPQSTTTVAPLAAGELPLVTHRPIPSDWVCAGIALQAVLRGDPTDPQRVWLENKAPGTTMQRIDVIWPDGYRVRFAPKAEVLDASDQVVLRDGDGVDGACGGEPDGALLIIPPFT